ncbi:MAG: nucleotidyltransferase domain-containing protein [Roseburia sp.]|nr:nucleotidyltransferase domain-containing protein [Roseburia sp.]
MITDLTSNVIEKIKLESVPMIKNALGTDLYEIILYGSCARGDFNKDSDVDIALLTKCDRTELKRYERVLAQIATELALKYFAVVNFVCFPKAEYDEKKAWYPYFKSIDTEGIRLAHISLHT